MFEQKSLYRENKVMGLTTALLPLALVSLHGVVVSSTMNRWYIEPMISRPLAFVDLEVAGGIVTTDARGQFQGVPAMAVPILNGFSGPHVKVISHGGGNVVRPGVIVNNQWQITYERNTSVYQPRDTDLAQAFVFQKINEVIMHAKQYITVPWMETQLVANVNIPGGNCLTSWNGSTLNFSKEDSQGCPNTALIADNIFREWGRGLIDNAGGPDNDAWSEGFADIVSMIMTGSSLIGIGMSEVDGSALRDLGPDKIYPRDARGGAKQEGLIIGSTFYDIYAALNIQYGRDRAKDLLSQYAFKSILTATDYTNVYDTVLTIDDDNGDLSDGTPNYCLLNRQFTRHGLAVQDISCP